MQVATVATRFELADALVLAETVREQLGTDLLLLVVDAQAPVALAGVSAIDQRELDLPLWRWAEAQGAFLPDELVELARPAVLRHLLARGTDVVCLLAPTVEVRDGLDAIATAATSSGLCVLHRLTQPLPTDRKHPDDLDIARLGPFRTTIVAATASGLPALDTWGRLCAEALRHGTPIDSGAALGHVATVYATAAPADLARHVDLWNLADRALQLDGARVTVDGEAVTTIDFAGHDPHHPHLLIGAMAESPRRHLGDDTDLAALLDRRAESVAAHRLPVDPTDQVQRVGHVVYDDTMRALYRGALLEAISDDLPRPPSPFEHPDEFVAWCNASEHGGPVPVSRYLAQIRRQRPDLLDAFPEVPGRSAPDLVRWAREHGRAEHPIPPELVPPALPRVDPPSYLQPGINLAGFLTAELGVGEVARRIARALDVASVPYATSTFAATSSRMAEQFRPDTQPRYDTNLLCINADSLGRFVQQVGPSFMAGRRNIGVWFWETADLPSMFHPAFGNLDEVWAASEFVAGALRRAAPANVEVVQFPLPIIVPEIDRDATRLSLGLPSDRFVFIVSFDFFSVVERKNPFGAIDAFRRAFTADEGPVLVVKSINGDRRPEALDRIRYAARGRGDIIVRDGYVEARTHAALLALSDCVVSLHRSEGFGFNLADAMALGTPVIATAFSGNVTFMQPDDCHLVGYDEVAVGPGQFPYLPESVWADPHVGEAARIMREVVDDPAAARTRAERARARVLRDFSPRSTGTFIRNRLAGLRAAEAATTPSPTGAHRRFRGWTRPRV